MKLLCFLLLFPCLAYSVTRNSDGSATDTQTQINNSANGDTVLLPASGSFSWTTAVSMPSSKYITLDLNGRTITLSGASGSLTINAHATGNNRITNGSIVKSGTGYEDFHGPFVINDERGSAAVRIDHIAFSITGANLANGTIVDMDGQGPGLMDHCTFSNMGDSYEFIHIWGWQPGITTGWTSDSGNTLAGSANIFYIEDCTFTGASTLNNPWVQGYYGCRIVFRYCTFNGVGVDMHGTGNSVGARWWEMYENDFNTTLSSNQAWSFSFRAGSGVIYNNAKVGGTRSANIGLCEEDSGYPALYQIGRGLYTNSPPSSANDTDDMAYVWGNTNMSVGLDECDANEVVGMVQEGRDAVTSGTQRPGYTAYTYPHPLQSGTSGITVNIETLNVTNLRIAP